MPTNFELKRLKPKLDITKKPENRVHELTDSNGALRVRVRVRVPVRVRVRVALRRDVGPARVFLGEAEKTPWFRPCIAGQVGQGSG